MNKYVNVTDTILIWEMQMAAFSLSTVASTRGCHICVRI